MQLRMSGPWLGFDRPDLFKLLERIAHRPLTDAQLGCNGLLAHPRAVPVPVVGVEIQVDSQLSRRELTAISDDSRGGLNERLASRPLGRLAPPETGCHRITSI